MNTKKKICLFSGKRGGFGAYLPLMQLISRDPEWELQILLGDMHASKEFGRTVEEAKRFFPNAAIELIEMGTGRGDSPAIRAENLGACLQKAAAILERLKPDFVLVHADRGEHLMVAFAALNLGIPVGHTQGGEVSGNIDDIQRHAITKLAHLHFPETETAARRIRDLGEEPWRIHVAGSTYIDRIAKKMYTVPAEAKVKYGIGAEEQYFISIFHPDTYLTKEQNYEAARNCLRAMKSFGMKVVMTYPCSDPGYQGVLDALAEVEKDPQFIIRKNIDNLDFLGLMSGAKAIIGNSSSAVVEAPYFQLPAVNIGKRQGGRDREENVVDADVSEADIKAKISYALNDASFRAKLAKCGHRLGNGQAAEKILQVIKSTPLDEKLLRKQLAE